MKDDRYSDYIEDSDEFIRGTNYSKNGVKTITKNRTAKVLRNIIGGLLSAV